MPRSTSLDATFKREATTALVGRKIVSVHYMTRKEATDRGWRCRPLVLALDDNTLIFAASDDEGNDGGVLFGEDVRGTELTFPAMR